MFLIAIYYDYNAKISSLFAFQAAVWKAIVERNVMRGGNEKFQKDYYKKLLANYNPSRKLTPAAKQVSISVPTIAKSRLVMGRIEY